MYDKQPSPFLAYSGSLFLIPAFTAFAYGNILTAVLNGLLSGTSIWYHLYRNNPAFISDQLVLWSVIIRAIFDGYAGGIPGMTLWLFAISYNYVMYFSPIRHHFVHQPIIQMGDRWHATIHIVSLLSLAGQQLFIEHPSF